LEQLKRESERERERERERVYGYASNFAFGTWSVTEYTLLGALNQYVYIDKHI
jgi:hypothetical protein